jgi:hypothetical protein
MASVIPRKTVLIPSQFWGSERKKMAYKKLVLQKILLWDRISRVCFYFFPQKGISSIFLLWVTVLNVILRSILFHGMVQKGIP